MIECDICGRYTCADYRTCQGELVALCERIAERSEQEREVRAVDYDWSGFTLSPTQWRARWHRAVRA